MGDEIPLETISKSVTDQYSVAYDEEATIPRPQRRHGEIPHGWSAWFGGPNVRIGPRVAPDVVSVTPDAVGVTSELESDQDEQKQKATKPKCSWQRTAALLASEYICLALMSFPWAYSVLGLVPGLIFTVVIAMLVQYTSLVLWEFCLRHPEVQDICDIGQMLFGGRWAWWVTLVMFILNNTFIQGLHVLVGAQYMNTMAGTIPSMGCQTVTFGVVVVVLSWLCSLPRSYKMLSRIATASAAFTFVSVILATIFAAIQPYPAGYNATLGKPLVTAFPIPGTSFVGGLGAFLTISYTFIGQVTIPTFIAEMEEPRDFPKALWACTIVQIIFFSVIGSVIYVYTGNQYMTAPAFGSLEPFFKKLAFSFMIPTLIFLGALYASVSARSIFHRIFDANSPHREDNTVRGWAVWAGLLLALWASGFLIANLIPFFSSLLSLMSSLFDSFFGFIFWAVAYYRMRKSDGAIPILQDRTRRGWAEGILNIFILVAGVFFLTCGTYASVEGIIEEFRSGRVGRVFQCTPNGI